MGLKRRGGKWYAHFTPFGKEVAVILDGTSSGHDARRVLNGLRTACKTGDFSGLDAPTRTAAARLYRNQGWKLPATLTGKPYAPEQTLTLWRACELFLTYPGVQDSPGKWRYKYALARLVEHFGKDRPLKSIWVPDLRLYQVARQKEGAAAATINRELGTFSRLIGVMQEMQLMDSNPVRLMKRLSEKEGQRQVYLSFQTVKDIAEKCPGWYQDILWMGYYTGMRRGELLGLKRGQLRLNRRIVLLGPADTKEGQWKRVPIHQNLVPMLEHALYDSPALIGGTLFSLLTDKGFIPVGLETFKNCWERACKKLDLPEPWPRFHDLRHTWKANARRSGMNPEIERAIMGHASRGLSVHERYGRISDQELLDAIDRMSFNHGDTEILVARRML